MKGGRIVLVFFFALAATSWSQGVPGVLVPAQYFGMHQHGGLTSTKVPPETFGAFRCWDGCGDGMQWYNIATCDPTVCTPTTNGNCNTPLLDWCWAGLDAALAELKTLGVNDVIFTFAGVPLWANGCDNNGNQPINGAQCNPNNQTCTPCSFNNGGNGGHSNPCANTRPWGCILPPDIDGNSDGLGTNAKFKAFVTALVQHVSGGGYLTTHAHILYYEGWNEWDDNNCVNPGNGSITQCNNYQGNSKCFCTFPTMQRMVADIRVIVLANDPSAFIITPSLASSDYQVLTGFLYCTGINAKILAAYGCGCPPSVGVCSFNTGSVGDSSQVDGINSHLYMRHTMDNCGSGTLESCAAGEGIMATANQYSKHLQTNYNGQNDQNKPFFFDEGSCGSGTGDPGGYNSNQQCGDYDNEAGYVARLYLSAWTGGVSRFYWYSHNSTPDKTGPIDNCYQGFPCASGLWWAGLAYNQVASWMVGKYVIQGCSNAGFLWTCTFADITGKFYLAVWDSRQSCTGAAPQSHGRCTFSSYAYPSGYGSYQTLDPSDGTIALSGGNVNIGVKPIFLLPGGAQPVQSSLSGAYTWSGGYTESQ